MDRDEAFKLLKGGQRALPNGIDVANLESIPSSCSPEV